MMSKVKKKLPDWMVRTLNLMVMSDFIDAIEAQPVIWNTAQKGYGDSIETSRAWKMVCSAMEPDFEDKDEDDQYEFCQQLHKKWKNIRDSYRRELRKLSIEQCDAESCDRRLYKYFDLLSFLKPVLGVGLPTTDKEKPEECEEQHNVGSPILSTRLSKRRKKQETLELNYQDDDPPVVSRGNTSKEATELCTYTPTGDGDTLFMMSLISEMKKIPENKRLHVKLKLMNTILEAQKTKF